MPSRTPTGRRLSGSAQRHRAGTLPRITKGARIAFDAVGPPPEDADEILTWGRRVLAASVHLVLLGQLDPQRARTIKDGIAALGMTHDRGKLEATVARIRREVAPRAQRGTVIEERGCDVPRPATARGGPRGPRAIPDDVPDREPPRPLS